MRNPQRTMLSMLIALVLLMSTLGLAGCGGGGDDSASADDGQSDTLSLGTSEVSLPERASLIETEEWGEVPSDQIGITLAEGADRDAATAVAEALGGTIVGEVEFIAMYQIAFDGTSEANLVAALDTAAASDGVEYAFPNQQVFMDAEIWGVRQSTYDDPLYGGDNGKGYEAAGVGRAWKFVKGSGVELSDVHVGIVDDGLYNEAEGKEGEFGGDVKISFPDKESGELENRGTHKDGSANAAGSHGTGVATIIGADPDNGGTSGVAGPLGENLEISMINQYSGKYGDVETTPDPDDPTKMVYGNGKTYVHGSLVALNKQIEAGATIINCSWGNPEAHPSVAAAYKKYFEKMAEKHPNVLFVCSGGNTGTALDGSRRLPSGLALPNMITVGAVNNDGTLASFSSKKSDNYEVTLAAPGAKAVVGQQADGSAERQNGTSFAAPHVAAAAAILRSINPDLSAGDIKKILVDTARPGITVGETSNLAPEETGGGVLAVDLAVLKVINDKRAKDGKGPFTEEMLEKLGVIDAVAITGAPGEYTVKGILEAVTDGGTSVKINVSGDHALGGETSQSLDAPGEVQWSLTLPDDEGYVTVTRLDSGASSYITIESLDINGSWSGNMTITDVTITDESAAEEEGCSVMIAEELIGKPLPMTMDITADDAGSGTALMTITAGEDPSSEQLTISYSGNTITFSGAQALKGMTANVSRDGENLAMVGSMNSGGPGYTMTATFSLSKPE